MTLSPLEVYEKLLAAYGHQHWWPAETPFEMMVGAILAQNTSWENVQAAINNLKEKNMLDHEVIANSSIYDLAEVIRPCGTYMQKARYLHGFALFYTEQGERKGFMKWPMSVQRSRLLGLYGIGPETADSIMLYALDRPIFVIDDYTKRLFVRLGHFDYILGYEAIQHYIQQRLPESLPLFQEFHALIVEHSKRHCKSKPLCDQCPLFDQCPTPDKSKQDHNSSLNTDVD